MVRVSEMYDSIEENVYIKKGARALCFTQIFSNINYCILYSTLVLYGTETLKLSPILMTALMGSFVAFNFGLHFLGGFMGGKFLSNRHLFLIGMTLEALGCFISAYLSYTTMMLGLAVFLAGSGLNATCLNAMVTQLFDDPDDPRRERAFLYNYSSMNLGFFFGFFVAGYFQLSHNYTPLFIIGGCTGLVAALIVFLNGKYLKEKGTWFVALSNESKIKNIIKAYSIVLLVLIALTMLLKHSELSNAILIAIAGILIIITFFLATGQKTIKYRKRMFAYIFLLAAGFTFYTLYQLAPTGLMLFIAHNTNLKILGVNIAPQWAGDINAVMIICGGPIMAWMLKKLRDRNFNISLPFLFSLSLLFIGFAYVILPIGIRLAGTNGLSSFSWTFWCYIFSSCGELCIAPIGYAMIGKLIPRKLQGMMMGLWLMMSGLGGIMASYLAKFALSNGTNLNPLVTNHGYFITFGTIGIIALVVGLILLAIVPVINRMINDTPKPAGEQELEVARKAI
jgi:proton-dependent oligopeptide transporter, POT family